jgi:hypothetical protein
VPEATSGELYEPEIRDRDSCFGGGVLWGRVLDCQVPCSKNVDGSEFGIRSARCQTRVIDFNSRVSQFRCRAFCESGRGNRSLDRTVPNQAIRHRGRSGGGTAEHTGRLELQSGFPQDLPGDRWVGYEPVRGGDHGVPEVRRLGGNGRGDSRNRHTLGTARPAGRAGIRAERGKHFPANPTD